MNIEDRVTIMMTTYLNDDFTHSATWAIRRYYPTIRVVYSDGHPDTPFDNRGVPNSQVVWTPGAPPEEGRNESATLVETPFVVDMNNDTKVLTPEALDLCLEVMDKYPECAVTGYYGIIVTDWVNRCGLVGTEYDGFTPLTAVNGVFALHRMAAWDDAGGMPLHESFYPGAPDDVMKGNTGNTGELTLCRYYTDLGWEVISPRKALPIIHWGYAAEWMPAGKNTKPFDKWFLANTHHTRCNPLKGERAPWQA